MYHSCASFQGQRFMHHGGGREGGLYIHNLAVDTKGVKMLLGAVSCSPTLCGADSLIMVMGYTSFGKD